jgi:hypothetical protein
MVNPFKILKKPCHSTLFIRIPLNSPRLCLTNYTLCISMTSHAYLTTFKGIHSVKKRTDIKIHQYWYKIV